MTALKFKKIDWYELNHINSSIAKIDINGNEYSFLIHKSKLGKHFTLEVLDSGKRIWRNDKFYKKMDCAEFAEKMMYPISKGYQFKTNKYNEHISPYWIEKNLFEKIEW
jgi:hypothetical protein